MMKALLSAVVVVFGWMGLAQAAIYNFTYKFYDTGAVVQGALTGNVEANGLIFDITGFVSLSVNGVLVTNNPGVSSTDMYIFGDNRSPTAALDASFLDFALSPGTGTALLFGVGDRYSQVIGANVAYDRNYGGSGNPTYFIPQSYTSSVTGVPEPASLALLSLAVVGTVAFRQRWSRVA